MQIKTYTGRDLAAALAAAREELGADALVLGTRERKAHDGSPGVEIRVGIERQRIEIGAQQALRRISRAVELRRRQQREAPTPDAPPAAAPAAADSPTPPAPAPARTASTRRPEPAAPGIAPALQTAVESLVRAGLNRDLATRFATSAESTLRQQAGQLGRAAEAGVAALLPFAAVPTAARVVFFVGPPGAGKTTTVAKLAARLVSDSARPVVFAQADSHRVGALAETEIYCKHIGAELAAIDGPDDLQRTLENAAGRARVLIDTCGVGHADDDRLQTLTALRSVAPDAQLVLLLPAGLHRGEAQRVLERFRPLRPTSVAFSKVDDAHRIGDLVTALANAELPLSFTTHGHRIPDDLEPATPRRLAALMLRAGRDASPATEIPS